MFAPCSAVLAVVVLAAAVLATPPMSSSHEHSSGEFGVDMAGLEVLRDACIRELGVSEDEIKGDTSANPHMKIKLCMLKKDGVIGKDGKFSPEGTLQHANRIFKMHPELLQEAKASITKCQKALEMDTSKDEALAMKIMTCLRIIPEVPHNATTTASPKM